MSTPLMRQYEEIKRQFPDALLLFQVGDFYELFNHDAQRAAAFLGIALTKRGYHNGQPIPLCGVPVHTKDHYITKLVRGGFSVAIVDQVSAAVPGKMVERALTNVITPGTLTDTKLLPEKSSSYLVALAIHEQVCALIALELLTGELWITVFEKHNTLMLESELARFSPDEIILGTESEPLKQHCAKKGYFISSLAEHEYQNLGHAALFSGIQLNEFIKQSHACTKALQLLTGFLQKNQPSACASIAALHWYAADDQVIIDATSLKNLEIVANLYDQSTQHSLLWVLDNAITSMGSRTIKKWITRPLTHQKRIEERLDAVDFLVQSSNIRTQITEHLKHMPDVERIVGRIALQRATIHDYRHLLHALQCVEFLQHILCMPLLHRVIGEVADFAQLLLLLQRSIHQDSTSSWLIAQGFDQELDRLRDLEKDGAHKLMELEQREIERTGIGSLKIKHNQIQGYAFEITKANAHLVPDDFQLIQSLVNRDRYSTPELKALEYDLHRAHADIQQIEQRIFQTIVLEVYQWVSPLRKAAQSIATLDALYGFAHTAYDQGYCKPQFVPEQRLHIHDGKHPVLAYTLKHAFIPNSLMLHEQERVHIITGPNMGGKSTFLRQTALISMMAQSGSFVPATAAQLPIIDRIFTRIGASDIVAQGKSTFFVEMEETALICNNATARSLVILDEVGRGTSTTDGFALAQAVVEYIHDVSGAFCLFATHYHQLGYLETHKYALKAYQAAVEKHPVSQEMLLLHKIIPGISSSSFGLLVAQKALLPDSIVARAQQLIEQQKEL